MASGRNMMIMGLARRGPWHLYREQHENRVRVQAGPEHRENFVRKARGQMEQLNNWMDWSKVSK